MDPIWLAPWILIRKLNKEGIELQFLIRSILKAMRVQNTVEK
jgi:hypothetical protein